MFLLWYVLSNLYFCYGMFSLIDASATVCLYFIAILLHFNFNQMLVFFKSNNRSRGHTKTRKMWLKSEHSQNFRHSTPLPYSKRDPFQEFLDPPLPHGHPIKPISFRTRARLKKWINNMVRCGVCEPLKAQHMMINSFQSFHLTHDSI